MQFAASRIQAAIWPEVMGVVTFCGAQLVAASIDASRAEKAKEEAKEAPYPIFQTLVTGASLLGGMAGIGYNRAPDFSKGLLFASGVGLMTKATIVIYDKATGQAVTTKFSDITALVPRQVKARSDGKQQTGTRQEVATSANPGGNPFPGRMPIEDRIEIPRLSSMRMVG